MNKDKIMRVQSPLLKKRSKYEPHQGKQEKLRRKNRNETIKT